MTLKKANMLLDFLILGENKLQNGLIDPEKSWNKENDSLHSIVKTLVDLSEMNIKIMNSIRKELQVKCKHPKKFRDKDPDGQFYCTNCNQDL